MGRYFMSDYENYKKLFQQLTNFKENPYHPFVWILGEPIIGDNVYIGGLVKLIVKVRKLQLVTIVILHHLFQLTAQTLI